MVEEERPVELLVLRLVEEWRLLFFFLEERLLDCLGEQSTGGSGEWLFCRLVGRLPGHSGEQLSDRFAGRLAGRRGERFFDCLAERLTYRWEERLADRWEERLIDC
jgi:hypothetical protein